MFRNGFNGVGTSDRAFLDTNSGRVGYFKVGPR
jgi:hypothetical protein